jgi:DNA-binding NtrC family response regulator
MPPLRERKEDIPLLVQHFVQMFNQKHQARVEGIRDGALEMLKGYAWPGNVRELKNVIERAVILAKGEWIELSHLPPYIQNPTAEAEIKIVLPVGITAAEAEKELILETLKKVGYNKAEAARQLGLDVKTIRNKLRSYGVE